VPHPDGCALPTLESTFGMRSQLGLMRSSCRASWSTIRTRREFYTEVFGFVKKHESPSGIRWITVVSLLTAPGRRVIPRAERESESANVSRGDFQAGDPARRSRSRTSNRSSSVSRRSACVHPGPSRHGPVTIAVCGTRAATSFSSIRRPERMRQGAIGCAINVPMSERKSKSIATRRSCSV